MRFQQTHVTCYSISGVSVDIPRYIQIQKGTKKFGRKTYNFRVRLVNSIEKEYYKQFYKFGIANELLVGSFRENPTKYLDSLDDFAKKKTKEIVEQQKLKGVGLYLKVEASRAVDLPVETNKFISDRQDFFVGIAAFPEERETFKNGIDGLISYLVCRTFAAFNSNYDSVLFSKCLNFSYYHGDTGKHLYDYFPELSAHLIGTNKESIQKIRNFAIKLRKAKVIYDDKTVKLYRKMIDEQDLLKKFIFGYFSLELASTRAFKKNKKKYNLKSKLRVKRDICEAYAEMQNEYGQDATNTRDRFLLNAFFHWDGISKSDYDQFKKAKKTRDKLTHGELPDDSAIPIKELNHVLAKVITNELC